MATKMEPKGGKMIPRVTNIEVSSTKTAPEMGATIGTANLGDIVSHKHLSPENKHLSKSHYPSVTLTRSFPFLRLGTFS